jgi:hypothetical protein
MNSKGRLATTIENSLLRLLAAGSFKVSVTNKSGGTLADDSTMVINYAIL